MAKKIKVIAIVAALALVCVFALTACESFSQDAILGGDASATVESNGGYVVKQGDYVYFVNGKMGFPAEPDLKYNYFGKIRKGAIARVGVFADGALDIKYGADGAVDYAATFKVIVPKNIMTNNTSGGFSIFGQWIYYVTPTTEVDGNSKLLTDYLDYYRTKIDGTDTQKIVTLKGQSLEYKFTPSGMIYVDPDKSTTLKTVTYNNERVGVSKVVSENTVGKVIFPVSETYAPGSTYVADYVFYVKKYSEDAKFNGHELWAATGDGAEKKLIDIKQFTGGEEPSNSVKALLYQMTLSNYRLTDDGGVELYYEKSHYPGQSVTYLGIYGLKVDSAVSADLAGETRFTYPASDSSSETNSFYPLGLGRGIILFGSPSTTLEKPKKGGLSVDEVDAVTFKYFEGATILRVAKEGETEYMYYLSDTKVMRAPLNGGENAVQISEDSVDTAWFRVDFLGGYFHYINSSTVKNSYLSRVKAGLPDKENEDLFDKKTGKPKDEVVAFRTEDDQKAYEKALES